MTLEHLTEICRRLNSAGVRYVLIGGFAVLLHGFERATRDVDLVIDASEENIEKVRQALQDLIPEACQELRLQDVRDYTVVRMAGEEIVVDLIHKIGEWDFEKLKGDIQIEKVGGIEIPVAGLNSLIETKKGLRDGDKRDLLFLEGKKEYLARK